MEFTTQDIIALSDKYQFDTSACVASFEKAAKLVSATVEVQKLDECSNHLDTEFMEALEKGLYLDVGLLPVHY